MLCNAFINVVLETISLGVPNTPLSNTRYLTFHTGNPGVDGTANDVTNTIFGATKVNSTGLNFGTPTAGWSTTNTTTLNVSSNTVGAATGVSHFTFWDETRPLIRGTFDTAFNVAIGDVFVIPIGGMTLSVANIGEAFATQVLRGIWDETIALSLSTTYFVRLFSSLNAQFVGTEITGTLGLSAQQIINPNSNFSVPSGTPPLIAYNADLLFGTALGSGTPRIAALCSASSGGNLIIYGNLTDPGAFSNGIPVKIPSEQLSISLANS